MSRIKRAKANLEFLIVEIEVKGEHGEKHWEWLLYLRQNVGDVGLVEG